jgi:hypothetical protein
MTRRCVRPGCGGSLLWDREERGLKCLACSRMAPASRSSGRSQDQVVVPLPRPARKPREYPQCDWCGWWFDQWWQYRTTHGAVECVPRLPCPSGRREELGRAIPA